MELCDKTRQDRPRLLSALSADTGARMPQGGGRPLPAARTTTGCGVLYQKQEKQNNGKGSLCARGLKLSSHPPAAGRCSLCAMFSPSTGAQNLLSILAPLTTFLSPVDVHRLTATCRLLCVARNEDLHWQQDSVDEWGQATFHNKFNGKVIRGGAGVMSHSDFIRLSSAKLLQSTMSALHFLASSPTPSPPAQLLDHQLLHTKCRKLENHVAALREQLRRQNNATATPLRGHSRSSRVVESKTSANVASDLFAQYETISEENKLLREHVEALETENAELRRTNRDLQIGRATPRRLRTVERVTTIRRGYDAGRLTKVHTISSEARHHRHDHARSKMSAGWAFPSQQTDSLKARTLRGTKQSRNESRTPSLSPTRGSSETIKWTPPSSPRETTASVQASSYTLLKREPQPRSSSNFSISPAPPADKRRRPNSAPLARTERRRIPSPPSSFHPPQSLSRITTPPPDNPREGANEGQHNRHDAGYFARNPGRPMTFRVAAQVVKAANRFSSRYIKALVQRLHTEDLGNAFLVRATFVHKNGMLGWLFGINWFCSRAPSLLLGLLLLTPCRIIKTLNMRH